jgi:hypothetical protein
MTLVFRLPALLHVHYSPSHLLASVVPPRYAL